MRAFFFQIKITFICVKMHEHSNKENVIVNHSLEAFEDKILMQPWLNLRILISNSINFKFSVRISCFLTNVYLHFQQSFKNKMKFCFVFMDKKYM